jgi:hypothetical protein
MLSALKPAMAASLAVRLIAMGMFAGAIWPAAIHAEEPTVEELQKRLDERDTVIRDLLRRVEALERRARPTTARADSQTGTGQTTPTANQPGAGAAPAAAVPPPTGSSGPQQAPQQAAVSPPPGPGQFEVSEEAAQRALERALVQSGALLLPPGTAEFVPGLSYTRREFENPGQVALLNGQLFGTQTLTRSNQTEASMLFRAGLPWTSQIEVTVPFDYKSVTSSSQIGGAALSSQTTDAWGFGDPAVTLIKQLAYEREWRPSLFGSIGWDTNYGQRSNGIALGTGFHELKSSLVAVKRQDPLVFTAGLGYAHSLEYNGVQAGDQYSTSLGMFLAVSPETSLRMSPQLIFADEARVNGARVAGSNQVAGIMTFGALSILAPGVVMDLSTDIGVTRDAPKFAIRAGFPIRFGLGL